MIKLKKKGNAKETSLVYHLYCIKIGDMYQIRLKDTQEVLSCSADFDTIVGNGKLIFDRYKTIEQIHRKIRECVYGMPLSNIALSERNDEQERSIIEAPNLKFLIALTGEEPVKKTLKIKPKLVIQGR